MNKSLLVFSVMLAKENKATKEAKDEKQQENCTQIESLASYPQICQLKMAVTLDSSLKGQARDKEEELKMDPPDICESQDSGSSGSLHRGQAGGCPAGILCHQSIRPVCGPQADIDSTRDG